VRATLQRASVRRHSGGGAAGAQIQGAQVVVSGRIGRVALEKSAEGAPGLGGVAPLEEEATQRLPRIDIVGELLGRLPQVAPPSPGPGQWTCMT
jgi:hypothetical protein